ncbi:uncharacterized protein LOC105157697 [Sesamum indicum]|uniref:Uncharacterized protein LOC105157697 n=1 Tax=Sesamum indicum TaxID=4182 RepID=A0A6I9SQQ3_SESIN|nr:uncharacterized protein LOC105157697 [Sesamum indicum]
MAEAQSHHHREFQDSWFEYEKKNDDHHDEKCTSSTSTSSIAEESMFTNGSSSISSSDDTADDASSSASSSFSSGGALYDLSEIMQQLPIKRGLSKFYQGKSESFTSLARVGSIEDLAKKVIPNRRHHLKASKSYGTGLNNSYKPYTLPKPIISKKTTRGSSFSSFLSKRGSFVTSKPPLTALHKNLEY